LGLIDPFYTHAVVVKEGMGSFDNPTSELQDNHIILKK